MRLAWSLPNVINRLAHIISGYVDNYLRLVTTTLCTIDQKVTIYL
ncbi:hypothetical protein SAMN05216409_10272 [Pseudomonas lutea]|uniref:Uncharacterized protein n=1 Tax=Pseudomonas lutea TaxID=243924 RepID=A0A9X8M9A6_9PSED|nr:hypothetical protein SAMN05216409_10272 [Pseudomonas lutea]